ncbi:unnamed protein product [Linum tenue]|uniref:Peptidase metallopeptidase domain-containing protein n=1 Tax=Linum tenue TaxID=586396 RepID=A0AAV0H5R2_9ROSI|nr:unnamed protein product [Linum tenue]CAI0627561.1 unnamed protein product [Linum tenue]
MKFRFKKILFPVITSLLIFSSFPPPVSCRFFPNTSSIPRNFPALNPNFTTAWDSFRNLSGCRAGEKLDGLSKLKKYFRHFGYIPDADGNLTDIFDDSLESAVETYQRNFNLNVTGQLDDRTIRQIVLPRCGNADIVNGSTTANTTGRIHAVERYSFFPGMPRWPASRRNLTYAFFPGNQVSREVKSVFAAAFHRWSAVAPLTFTETEDYSNTDIRVGFFGGDHGDGDAFDGVSGTLAHALEPPSGRLHLDEAENWVLSGEIEVATAAVDLESVAVHEIGHLLGLGHSSDESAIMFPSIGPGTRKVELAQDDIDGLLQLYGSNPDFNGTSTPSVQGRDSSAARNLQERRWGVSFLLAVGFILLFE